APCAWSANRFLPAQALIPQTCCAVFCIPFVPVAPPAYIPAPALRIPSAPDRPQTSADMARETVLEPVREPFASLAAARSARELVPARKLLQSSPPRALEPKPAASTVCSPGNPSSQHSLGRYPRNFPSMTNIPIP